MKKYILILLTVFVATVTKAQTPPTVVIDCTMVQSDTFNIAIARNQYFQDSTVFKFLVKPNQHIRIIPCKYTMGVIIPLNCQADTLPQTTANYYIDSVLTTVNLAGCTQLNTSATFGYWDYQADSVDTIHQFVDQILYLGYAKYFEIETVAPLSNKVNELRDVTNITVGPNPVEDKLVISYKAKETSLCQVFNLTGSLVYTNTIYKGENSMQIDFDNFEQGMYIVKIENQSFKIVK